LAGSIFGVAPGARVDEVLTGRPRGSASAEASAKELPADADADADADRSDHG
jgi:hypothetical protein